MPTPEQLKQYADQLPAIYRDVLTAFVNADPGRRYGDSVAVAAVLAGLRRGGRSADTDGYVQALYNLEDAGFLAWLDIFPREDRAGGFRSTQVSGTAATTTTTQPPGAGPVPGGRYAPTEVGEELLAALTGVRAKKVAVPALPAPTW